MEMWHFIREYQSILLKSIEQIHKRFLCAEWKSETTNKLKFQNNVLMVIFVFNMQKTIKKPQRLNR